MCPITTIYKYNLQLNYNYRYVSFSKDKYFKMPSYVPKRRQIHNVVTQRNYILNTNTYNCLINFRFPGRNTCGYPANICSVVAPTIFQNQYVCTTHTHRNVAHQYICTDGYKNKFESLSSQSYVIPVKYDMAPPLI